jgi:hypothetical protein
MEKRESQFHEEIDPKAMFPPVRENIAPESELEEE